MKTYRDLIREGVQAAIDRSELGVAGRTALRIATRLRREELENEILAQLMAEGALPAGAALDAPCGDIDLEQIIEIFLIILPIVLKLLPLII
jgi:hypothetical protein